MKFINFKSRRFSTILKNINFKSRKFFTILKNINFKTYKFFTILKNINFKRYNITKIYKYFDLTKYKYIPIYFFIFLTIVYLCIPIFFNYDKLEIKNTLCRELDIKCSIQGEVKYSPLPSPRLKFKNLLIKDFLNEKLTLGNIENVSLKLSIYNLIDREKLNVTQINFENFEINFDLDKIYKYKKFLYNKFYSKRVNFSKGKINFLEDKKHIATIENVNFEYNPKGDAFEAALDGDFIGDKIVINFENNKNRKPSKIFVVKLSNLGLFTKVNIIDNDLNKDKDILTGNFLFKKNKNRLTAIFDYKNGKIVIKNSNLRNEFLDGKLNGKVKFLPYFDFDLNLDLNSVNFNRLYNLLVSLNDKNRRELFKINKKMNGKLALSANKIFSKHTLINSFESQIKFINGNIIFEQALFNLGKLGATDITGIIKNDEKFSNFRFENNIYLDNLKRFYSKFGVYNKQKIPYNLFISGNLDLVKFILRLDEISDEEKFKDEDIKYIENEFNNLVLEEGYATLFNFARFKEFIKLIATESN